VWTQHRARCASHAGQFVEDRLVDVEDRELVGLLDHDGDRRLVEGPADEAGVDVDDMLHAVRPSRIHAVAWQHHTPICRQRRGAPRERLVLAALFEQRDAVAGPHPAGDRATGKLGFLQPSPVSHVAILSAVCIRRVEFCNSPRMFKSAP